VPGPTIIAGHETMPNQVAMKGRSFRVPFDVPTLNTWTRHKIIHSVCLSHIEKNFQGDHVLGSASIDIVHPSLSCIHLHHVIKLIKTIQINNMNDHNTDVKDKVANLDRRGKRGEKLN